MLLLQMKLWIYRLEIKKLKYYNRKIRKNIQEKSKRDSIVADNQFFKCLLKKECKKLTAITKFSNVFTVCWSGNLYSIAVLILRRLSCLLSSSRIGKHFYFWLLSYNFRHFVQDQYYSFCYLFFSIKTY